MKNIKKDIESKQLKRVYLVYGEEKYLVRSVKKLFAEKLVGADDNMNYSKFSGKECSEREVIELSDTLPFFAEYRVIIAENTGWFKSSTNEISDYIKDIPDSSVIVFIESEIDKRNRLYKQVKNNGYVCECNRLNRPDLMKWILVRLNKENKKITRENMDYFLEKVGDDMDNLLNETDKLISYTLNREVIEKEDIDKVCISEITGKIFEMVDCIGNKNQKKAIELYYDLISVREAPMKILYMLSRQFNIMLQLKELQKSGISAAEMSKKVGLQNFIVNKTLSQCKNFSHATLKNAIEYCLKMEESVKNGNMGDKIAVEMIIIKYSK